MPAQNSPTENETAKLNEDQINEELDGMEFVISHEPTTQPVSGQNHF